MRRSPSRWATLVTALSLLAWIGPASARVSDVGGPGCPHASARACLQEAIDAMGGRTRLQAVDNVELQGIGHTRLAEESYRQKPFQTSYVRFHTWLDFSGKRLRSRDRLVWPQAGDTSPVERRSTVVVTSQGGIYRSAGHTTALSAASMRRVANSLVLNPLRLLLTAASAGDLHFVAPERVHGTLHAALRFTDGGVPVTLLLDPYSHLPDAFESTRSFDDFWYAWGDVRQRVYFDNWILVDGIRYPTTRVEQRNGLEWRSMQALRVRFNVPLHASDFRVPRAYRTTRKGSVWEHPFHAARHVELAPGVDLYPGAWNSTLIRQRDGVVILEAPISPTYTRGILAQVHRSYPQLPVKAVLTTSDAWPHVGGVREVVAAGLPVYALDLNMPLLRRIIDAPHTLHPDTLQKHPRVPKWHVVSAPTVIGHGANRVALYPLRGADTGRQYMVYLPARQLLYASDTLVIDPATHKLYQPELMREVVDAVRRAHLKVRTVFAMHQGPTPWKQVLHLLKAAERMPKPLSAAAGG